MNEHDGVFQCQLARQRRARPRDERGASWMPAESFNTLLTSAANSISPSCQLTASQQ